MKIIALSFMLSSGYCEDIPVLPFLGNGVYEVHYSISDMVFIVTLEFKIISSTPSRSYEIAVVNDRRSFVNNKIITVGVEYNEKAMFVVPRNEMDKVDVVYFWIKRKVSDNEYTGDGDVPFGGPNVGNNKFTFTMTKVRQSDK